MQMRFANTLACFQAFNARPQHHKLLLKTIVFVNFFGSFCV